MKKVLILLLAGMFVCAFATGARAAPTFQETNTYAEAVDLIANTSDNFSITRTETGYDVTWSDSSGSGSDTFTSTEEATGITFEYTSSFTVHLEGSSGDIGTFNFDPSAGPMAIGFTDATEGAMSGTVQGTALPAGSVAGALNGLDFNADFSITFDNFNQDGVFNGATGEGSPIPELPPGAMQLMVLGLSGLASRFRKRS